MLYEFDRYHEGGINDGRVGILLRSDLHPGLLPVHLFQFIGTFTSSETF